MTLYQESHAQLAKAIPLLIITLLGFSLRLILLDRFPFREDEAIYSFWALHFWYEDPLFLSIWPDKPPIFIWLLSLTFQLFGESEASARLLNIGFSTLTIPLIAAIGQQLWGYRAALFTAVAFALNPFAISFAATAYTDPTLILFGSLALYMALNQQGFWAGMWLGLAIMTKQQGIFYVPLVMAFLLLPRSKRSLNLRLTLTLILRLLLGLTLILTPILYWDSLRWSVAPSPWDLSITNYNQLTVLPISAWPKRLTQWLDLAWYLTANPMLCTLEFMLVSIVIIGIKRSHSMLCTSMVAISLLLVWSISFFLFHIITSVQIWDRYLLPLAPIVALIFGWGVSTLIHFLEYLFHEFKKKFRLSFFNKAPMLILPLCTILLLPSAITAARGGYPIGGDHGAYQGYHEALSWLEEAQSEKSILYHQQLGWHYQFSLYHQIRLGQYELRWFPNAPYLADNAAKTATQKFLLQPNWATVRNMEMHLMTRSLYLKEQITIGQFVLYELKQSPQPPCIHCFCLEPSTLFDISKTHQNLDHSP